MTALPPPKLDWERIITCIAILFAGFALVMLLTNCGRILPKAPTLDEFLKGKVVKCVVEVTAPDDVRRGETIKAEAELSECHEVKPDGTRRLIYSSKTGWVGR